MTITITKAKLAVAVLAVVLLVPATAYATHVFGDVPDDKFYAGPVEWASDNGITTGTGPTTFEPDRGVTRGESVTFLKRYNDNIVEPALDTLTGDVASNASDIASKADASAVYTQAEVDTLLDAKADAVDVPGATVASASSTPNLALTNSNQTVLTADVSTSDAGSLLVSAAIEVDTDGGDNDNMNCNIDIDGTDGLRQSVSIPDAGFQNAAVLTLSQVFPVGAGTHTVIVECNEGIGSNSTVESASLAILAID